MVVIFGSKGRIGNCVKSLEKEVRFLEASEKYNR